MKINSASSRKRLLLGVSALGLVCAAPAAHAFDYETDSGVDIRLDNTIQYSVTERVAPLSPYLANIANSNDGDNNLRAGIVSNRFDLLSKLDVSYQGFGFDASADSFYDTVYNQKTQQGGAGNAVNSIGPVDQFTSATRTQAGRNIELRNLFVYGSGNIGNVPVSLKVGRLVNLYGESLLFAGNGISYGQAPIDVLRAASVPNTQAKDLFLPVGQALVTVQPTESISLSAYYQFEWERFNFMPVGSYFSPNDFVGPGSQRFLIAGPLALYHGNDLTGKSTGQFGMAVHYDPPATNWDFGLYALQYNDSEPQVVLTVGTAAPRPPQFSLGTYQLEYANGIQIYGASTSTSVGPLNLAGEVSVRTNEDLFSTAEVGPFTQQNNSSNPAYATGDTLHYQSSFIYAGPKASAWDAISAIGEVAGVNLLSIDKNRDSFYYNSPLTHGNGGHMAFGLRTIVTLTYYQVFPGLDVSPDIGLGWNFMGRAPDTAAFNNTGIDRGGDLSLGVGFTYLNKWTGSISYTNYIAPPQRNNDADRDFVSFNVERTF
jgi:hypothetical protein